MEPLVVFLAADDLPRARSSCSSACRLRASSPLTANWQAYADATPATAMASSG